MRSLRAGSLITFVLRHGQIDSPPEAVKFALVKKKKLVESDLLVTEMAGGERRAADEIVRLTLAH